MSWMRSCCGGPAVGVGAAAVKSAPLSSVSGPAERWSDSTLVWPGASVPSRTTAVPYPTRSTIDGSAAQSAAVLQVSAAASSTRATVPLLPDMLIVPVTCAGGRSVVPPEPAASPIR